MAEVHCIHAGRCTEPLCAHLRLTSQHNCRGRHVAFAYNGGESPETRAPVPVNREQQAFGSLERQITSNLATKQPGLRDDWQEIEGCWVLGPPQSQGAHCHILSTFPYDWGHWCWSSVFMWITVLVVHIHGSIGCCRLLWNSEPQAWNSKIGLTAAPVLFSWHVSILLQLSCQFHPDQRSPQECIINCCGSQCITETSIECRRLAYKHCLLPWHSARSHLLEHVVFGQQRRQLKQDSWNMMIVVFWFHQVPDHNHLSCLIF